MIEMSKVSKTYARAGNSAVHALREISLSIADRDFVAIRGASGSGKSTLLNIIGCLDVPTSGSYLLANEDVSHHSDRALSRARAEKIGFIFQSFNLLPATTARENVELPMIYARGRVNRRKALELLERVGLQDRANHFAGELSGGQQQRVAIARALINDPPLILADEPTGNLDSAASLEVMEILTKLHKEARTIVLVTHDDKIARYSEREVCLHDGTILSDNRLQRRDAPQLNEQVAP
jgi:putative ABC transport system ATP-binding protein